MRALIIILALSACAPMRPMTASEQYQLGSWTSAASQWGYAQGYNQPRAYPCTNPWGQLMACVQ